MFMKININRKWRKNRYSTVIDIVKGCVELNRKDSNGTYLLFRMRKGSSKLITRVVSVHRGSIINNYKVRITQGYGETKLQYLTKAYPNLKYDLEKKVSWELLKV